MTAHHWRPPRINSRNCVSLNRGRVTFDFSSVELAQEFVKWWMDKGLEQWKTHAMNSSSTDAQK